MGDFFNGWRRKIGLLTLVMACLFMGGWVRGHIVEDCFAWGDAVLEKGKGECHMVSASRNGLMWKKFETLHPSLTFEIREANTRWSCKPITTSFSANPLMHPTFDYEFERRWQGGGFDYGVLREKWNDFVRLKYCTVPYWSIVIPLTLLSAFLLLSKPRNSTQAKLMEPISIEGT